jgi:hypothetical protein
MPVVAAARLKGHIENADLTGGERGQIALSYKILCISIVGRAHWKQKGLCIGGLGIVCRVTRLCPDVLCHAERRPRLGPACIKGQMRQNLGNFRLGNAIFLGCGQVISQRGIHHAGGNECGDGDKAAIPQGKFVLPRPDLPEQDVIIKLCEFGSELPKGLTACCLFDHSFFLLTVR